MSIGTIRWVDVTAPWTRRLVGSEWALLLWTIAAAALALWQPLASVLLALTLALFAIAHSRPQWLVYALVVLMGNVKINYYAGFFTVFPEYALVLVAGAVWCLRWTESPRELPERGFFLRLLAWTVAGALSFVFAPLVGKVLARVVLMMLTGVIVLTTLEGTRSRRALGRALAVWEVSAALFAVYGVAQMIALIGGGDLSPSFVDKFANPDMALGVGAPFALRLGLIFRANGLFNDPNILAGYLAAAMSATFALCVHHAAVGNKVRARWESVALLVMSLCMLLTFSRSGMLALAAGALVVLWQYPEVLRLHRVVLFAAAGIAVVVGGSLLAGADPMLLVHRISGSLDRGDFSNRTHQDAFVYGLRLLARYPVTGGGLGNFGEHFGPEVNAYAQHMMTHCAPMTYYAESGLLGGTAFLALIGWIASRPLVALGIPNLRKADPQLHAWATGLLAAVIAIDVANLFYDYYMRTFVWVISTFAVVVARYALSAPKDPAA